MSDPTPTFSNPFEFDQLLLEPIHAMMQTGIRVDYEQLEKFRSDYVLRWQKFQAKLDQVAGRPLNTGSPKQMKEMLYGELGLPTRRLKGTPTVNEDALRAIMAECVSKVEGLKSLEAKARWMRGALVCRLALNITGVRKRISSYLGLSIKAGRLHGEVPFTDSDGRIRSTISVGGTKTARFSHSKTLWGTGVNLATIPRELRAMFIADEGFELAEFDLERGESWIYAHLSEDPELLRIHLEGLDFHSETAAAISAAFGEPKELEWIIANRDGEAYKLRYLGKKINHASAYRMGPFRGTQVVNEEADETGITVTQREFKNAQALWKQKYWMMPAWWNEIEAQISRDRTMRTLYGRHITFHDHYGSELFKEATAWVPQSTSVDYMNRGLLRVYHRFQKKGAWGLKLLTQTHDSILVQYEADARAEAVPAIAEALKDELTIKRRTFSIPIEAGVGQNWGKLEAFAA